jgi:probable rRNA maturation factor
MIEVLVNNEIGFDVPEPELVRVVRSILTDHDVERGEVSLAIIDDASMHALNREHLQHDYPTDVLSFLLGHSDRELDGEVIVSCETATRTALEYGWSARDELMLYFIHGCLHLVGYDDHRGVERAEMWNRESRYLLSVGIQYPKDHAAQVLRDQEASA